MLILKFYRSNWNATKKKVSIEGKGHFLAESDYSGGEKYTVKVVCRVKMFLNLVIYFLLS